MSRYCHQAQSHRYITNKLTAALICGIYYTNERECNLQMHEPQLLFCFLPKHISIENTFYVLTIVLAHDVSRRRAHRALATLGYDVIVAIKRLSEHGQRAGEVELAGDAMIVQQVLEERLFRPVVVLVEVTAADEAAVERAQLAVRPQHVRPQAGRVDALSADAARHDVTTAAAELAHEA